MLQLYMAQGKLHMGVLCAVMVATPYEEQDCAVENAEEMHQHVAWIGGHETVRVWISWVCLLWSKESHGVT